MKDVSKLVNKQTGLKLSVLDSVILKTGREAYRASLKVGTRQLAITLVELPDSSSLTDELEDLEHLSEIERVIILTPHLLQDQMNELRARGIGYIDESGNYSIPIEIVSNYRALEYKNKSNRASSILNEFLIGFLFFKNFGLLEKTQLEVAELIGKSPTTVNFVLKKMEAEGFIVKTERGYHLTNIENYFERWKYILSEYKAKNRIGKYRHKAFLPREGEKKWNFSLSGPFADTLNSSGYLAQAEELTVFVETKNTLEVVKDLKLIPEKMEMRPCIIAL
jgi:DNA-binding Lrp family transcriptional regulator